MDGKARRALLLAILCIGLALRLYGLDRESLWLDEATSITVARYDLADIIHNRAADTHPPLYYFLLHYWMRLDGDSEFSTRLLSVLFGVLAIPVIYRVGVLLFDATVGLCSALVFALSEFHIRYSQEVKGYSLLVLLVLLSFYFFMRLHTTKRPAVVLGYVLSSTLLIYTHVYGLFTIASQNLYVLLSACTWGRVVHVPVRTWLRVQALLLAAYLPWMGIFFTQVQTAQRGFWITQPSLSTLWSTFSSYAGSDVSLGLFLVVLIVALGVGSPRRPWRDFLRRLQSAIWRARDSREIGLLLVWLLTPILAPFVLSFLSAPVFLTRCTIGASVAFYLLIGKALTGVAHSERLQTVAITAVCLFSVVNVWQYHHKIHKEQWRDVVRYVEHHADAGDVIVFHSGFVQKAFDYYLRRVDLVKKPFPPTTAAVDAENVAALPPLVQGYATVWVILSHGQDEGKLIQKTLGAWYELSFDQHYVGIEVLRYAPQRTERGQSQPLTKG